MDDERLEITQHGDLEQRFIRVPKNDDRVEEHLVDDEVVDCRSARLTRIRQDFEQFDW